MSVWIVFLNSTKTTAGFGRAATVTSFSPKAHTKEQRIAASAKTSTDKLTWIVTLGVTVSGVCSSSSDTFLLAHHDLFMRSLHWHSQEKGGQSCGDSHREHRKNDAVDALEETAVGATPSTTPVPFPHNVSATLRLQHGSGASKRVLSASIDRPPCFTGREPECAFLLRFDHAN